MDRKATRQVTAVVAGDVTSGTDRPRNPREDQPCEVPECTSWSESNTRSGHTPLRLFSHEAPRRCTVGPEIELVSHLDLQVSSNAVRFRVAS